MSLLLQYTLIFASVLILVALGGCFSEHSGVINLGLEGIMIMGALGGALTMRYLGENSSHFVTILAVVLVSAAVGMVYSCLLAVACINFKADQTLVGTALNLLGTAGATVIVKAINTAANPDDVSSIIQYAGAKKAFTVNIGSFEFSWFMLITALLLVASYVLLYKTRFGLRLMACGEHPQAADSVGINVYKMRWAGVLISGFLGGLGGIVFITAGVSEWRFEYGVAGFGFLSLAVMIFGQWKPQRIALAALLFPGLGQRLHRLCLPEGHESPQLRLQYAALHHLPDRAGLYLQELPRTQGGGRSLRQGSAITESTVCASKSVFPHCGKTLFLCFFSAEK
jgi:ABC-type uncharacterized transport system permease subunit